MSRRVPRCLLWLASLLALYLVLPLAAGVQQAGLADWRAIDRATLARACLVSALSATLASALIALGGIPLGYALARSPSRWTNAVGFVVQLPLALPPLASGVLLLFLLGAYSPVGRWLGDVTDSLGGIVLAQTFVASPFLIIAARSAFESVDPVLEDVAATLGHGPWARFRHVSLPLAWPAIRAGLLLAWLRAFGEFGATVMVAYHPYTLPVYTYVAFGAQGLPAMLPILLPTLAVAMGVIGLTLVRPRRAADPITEPGAPSRPALAPPPVVPRAPSVRPEPRPALAFSLRRRLGGFVLEAAWSPQAGRLAILGPSGSGKSLTLRMIAGLERPDAGWVRVGARDLTALAPEVRRVAYVPQGYGLMPDRSVRRQLLLASGATEADAASWIARLGLSGLEHRRPAELSLGQQQRVALARALLRPAALVLLDEPFSALDAPLRARLRRDMLGWQQRITAATVLVTHDPEEAMLLADELLLMDAGRVLQAGPVAQVAASPVSARAAALLGLVLLDAVAESSDSICVGRGIRLAVSGPGLQAGRRVAWTVRREFVQLRPPAVRPTEDHPGHVIAHRPVAGGVEATVALGEVRLRALLPPGSAPEPGPCRVAISRCAIQAWPFAADPAAP